MAELSKVEKYLIRLLVILGASLLSSDGRRTIGTNRDINREISSEWRNNGRHDSRNGFKSCWYNIGKIRCKMWNQLEICTTRYIMKITDKNKEIVKAFVRIMRDIGVSQTTSEMITSMLKSKTQIDALVKYTEENPKATEAEILVKAQEITEDAIH